MRNVSVSYRGQKILSGIDWRVKKHQHWQISGPNGSGKTTLMNLLTGENTQAYANDIELFGRRKGSGESLAEIKERIGHFSPAFHTQYRVRGNVLSVLLSGFFDSIGLYRDPTQEHLHRAQEWLQLLGLKNATKTLFEQLSFGRQRLLLIARAMIKQPALLILDEPSQGLDDESRQLVLQLIERIAAQNLSTLLYVNHYRQDCVPAIRHQLELHRHPNGGFTSHIKDFTH